MARKRKIPVRKHHGIRDPLKQQEEKQNKLKNVTNNPPAHDNDQKVSSKFSQFQKLVSNAKTGSKFKKLHAGQEDKPKVARNRSKIKPIRQLPDEEDTDYLRRVNRMTSESLREAQYEAKYGVTVQRNPSTGEIIVKKKPKNELDELLKQKLKEKKSGKIGKRGKKGLAAKSAKPLDRKLAKELIKQAIKEDEEEKSKEKSQVKQEYTRDVIKFGEVVHAPPTISTLPRKAQKNDTVPRPGRKNNLLLKNLLNESDTKIVSNSSSNNNSAVLTNKSKSKTVEVTKAELRGKRKDLPVATRAMLEKEQAKMIELYRELKKSKLKTPTS